MSTPYTSVPATPGVAAPERSIGELFSDLSSETGTLIRQEVKLAVTEVGDKAALVGRQVAFIAAGGLLATLGLLLLLEALVIGLDAYMELWVSSLLVGAVVSAIAAALTAKGIATLRHTELKPERTLQSIEDNKSLLQGQTK